MAVIKWNTISSLTWIVGFMVHLLCIGSLISSAPVDKQNGTSPDNESIPEAVPGVASSDSVHTTVELSLTTEDSETTTTEIPPTTDSAVENPGPEEGQTPPASTEKAPTSHAEPTGPSTSPTPAVQTTPEAVVKPTPSKLPPTPTVALEKRGDSSTQLPTTEVTTPTPILTTTQRATITPHATTQPKATTTNKPTERAGVATTQVAKTSTPVQPVVTTRVPTTKGHQPKTEGNQPKTTTEKPTVTSKPDSGTDESGKGDKANNSVFSKLMLPVVLGIIAAILIICFAYGIRACKKKDRSRTRGKMMHNGKDQEMRGNFDRMKLLADSSEDEF